MNGDKWMVVIRPRRGVSATDLAEWLETNFQAVGEHDRGPCATHTRTVFGGNPLVNAEIVVEPLRSSLNSEGDAS